MMMMTTIADAVLILPGPQPQAGVQEYRVATLNKTLRPHPFENASTTALGSKYEYE